MIPYNNTYCNLLVAVVGWSIYLLTCTQIIQLLIPRTAQGNIHRCHLFKRKNKRCVCTSILLQTAILARTKLVMTIQ